MQRAHCLPRAHPERRTHRHRAGPSSSLRTARAVRPVRPRLRRPSFEWSLRRIHRMGDAPRFPGDARRQPRRRVWLAAPLRLHMPQLRSGNRVHQHHPADSIRASRPARQWPGSGRVTLGLQYSSTPLLHYSTTPVLQCSSAPVLQCSSAPVLQSLSIESPGERHSLDPWSPRRVQ
jgi:hypothetical protein